jgi:DNA-binding winged helix-turn-helix (wHTH) protein
LRLKVDPDGTLIETVYGTGYIFNRQTGLSNLQPGPLSNLETEK